MEMALVRTTCYRWGGARDENVLLVVTVDDFEGGEGVWGISGGGFAVLGIFENGEGGFCLRSFTTIYYLPTAHQGMLVDNFN